MKNRETLLLSGLVAVMLFLSLPLHAAEKHFFVLPKGKAGRDTNFFSLDKEDGRSASTRSKEGMSAMMAMAAQDSAREERRVFKEAALALEESEREALLFKQKLAQEQAERQAKWNKMRAEDREKATNQFKKNTSYIPHASEQKQAKQEPKQSVKPPSTAKQEPRLDDGGVVGTTITPRSGSGRGVNDPIRLPR